MKVLDIEIKKLGRERDVQISRLKGVDLSHKEVYYHAGVIQCKSCSRIDFEKSPICDHELKGRWSRDILASFELFNELPIKKSYIVYINEYDKKIHEVKIGVFPHIEFKGDSFQDAVTQAYIFYKEKERNK